MKRTILSIVALLCMTFAMAQQKSHTIQRGETIESIAKKYNVSVYALQEANPDIKDMFYVGMKLVIPEGNTHIGSNDNNIYQDNVNNDYSVFPPMNGIEDQTHFSSESENDDNHVTPLFGNVVWDRSDTGIELTAMTDKKLKFKYWAAYMGWNFYGVALRFGAIFEKKPKTEGTRNEIDYAGSLGYNFRIKFADFLYLDLRPYVNYAHSEYEIANGYETKETKNGHYYSVTTWKKKKTDGFSCSFEPAIGLRPHKSFDIRIGYSWDFNKFKFKKKYKSEGAFVGLTWYIND